MKSLLGVLASMTFTAAQAEGIALSGGLDARAQTHENALTAVGFLNARDVISQDGADRWILVAQFDSGDNFKEPHLYQTFVQLKGPLGHWNVRAGRFIVPFGLLTSYDSERQVLNTIEPLSLGLKLATGMQLNGFTSGFDYAISVTNGPDSDRAIVAGRMGWSHEDVSVGVSALAGTLPETASKESVELPGDVLPGVPLVRKRRAGLDVIWNDGPNVWRGEAVLGTDDGDLAQGGYLEYERAVSAVWSWGANVGGWGGATFRWRTGAVLSRLLGRAGVLRAAYVDERELGGRGHTFVLQYYWDFSRAL